MRSTEWYHFQWPWVTSDPNFKVTTFFDIEYLRNDTRWSHSYYRTSVGSRMRSIERWHLQWPWRTPNPFFEVTAFLKSNIWETKLLKNTNKKRYTIYQIIPLSMTLSDLWPRFQGRDIFWRRMSEKRHVLKSKLHLHKRKVYLTYGMILCLVTLTYL